jgi:RNA polymerase sigma-70 factor (ECF subfamily)
MRAFASISSFRGEASLRTWLCRIVLNEALGRVRRYRPTLELEFLETAGPGQVVPLPFSTSFSDPEQTMAQDQIREILEQAIDELPLAFRTVLVARLIEEMSVEETADLLGLRTETVKTRLHRARRLLRAALEKRFGAVLRDAFPFDGERCQRMADRVFARLSFPG